MPSPCCPGRLRPLRRSREPTGRSLTHPRARVSPRREREARLRSWPERCFTVPNIWTGGHYQLKLCLGSPVEGNIQSVLKAIWQAPHVEGPYALRDKEPSDQPLVPAGTQHDHLFGIAAIRGYRVPCGTFVVREEGSTETRLADFICFYIPLSALSLAYDVGGYPFSSHEKALAWRPELDSWFIHLLRQTALQFQIGVIGFEAELRWDTVVAFKATGIPRERFDGIVVPADGDIEWHPPTRFDLITF